MSVSQPEIGEIADEFDQLDWDVDKFGHMAESASEDEPQTEAYTP